ncbi:PH domain-containing protein [Bariatricus sp. SGI.154]|uniref:PH domain-containing protein n=1 Tax=Bariatricus sp. SGI.154 TaxID=3420549 RepID=UPI003D023C87
MTFKGKIDKWWYVVTALLNGLTFGTIVYVDLSRIWIYIIGLIVVDLYFVPVLFRNEVIVDKKQIVVQFGLLKKTIPTRDIVAVRKTKGYAASFAASSDRVGIEARRMSLVFVSVEDNGELIRELMQVNKGIKYMI